MCFAHPIGTSLSPRPPSLTTSLTTTTHTRPAPAPTPRRSLLLAVVPGLVALGGGASAVVTPRPAHAADATATAAPPSNFEPMALLEGKDYGKSRTRLSDFVKTKTGLQVCAWWWRGRDERELRARCRGGPT